MYLYKKSVRTYINIIKALILIVADIVAIVLTQEKTKTFWLAFASYNFLYLLSFSDLIKAIKDKSMDTYLKYPQVIALLVLNVIITLMYILISIFFRKKELPVFILFAFAFFFLAYVITIATFYINTKTINNKERKNYIERKYFQNIVLELERIKETYQVFGNFENKFNSIIDFAKYNMQVNSSDKVKKQERVIAIAISTVEESLKNGNIENLDCLFDGILFTLKERENILKTEV